MSIAVGVRGQIWTPTTLNTNYYWRGVAASADGTRLAAAASQSAGDGIYLSTNSGVTWTQAETPPGSWGPVACSADGTELVAVNGGVGGIYVSTDSGATWNPANVPAEEWTSIAVSADGATMLAAYPPDDAGPADLYASTNSGDSWFSPTNIDGSSIAVACSEDGSMMAALTYGGEGESTLIVSTNFGLTWQTAEPSSSEFGLGCAADGSKLYAAGTNFYVSSNWGATWPSPGPEAPVFGLFACSANGSVLMGRGPGDNSFPIYSSKNSGSTWISNNVPPAVWGAFACSADGSVLVAAAEPGGVWISKTPPPSPQLNVFSANGEVNLSWIIPSTNMVLEQSLNLNPVNWTILTNSPCLNPTNLQEQLTLQPANPAAFFRLVSQ
ncbi:MAG TPA: sialidase family protein [Candidatus Sulfotelmatobacter sp.]|nr:sialidase family protein [Candidatus Sulfotelmatobacter sp.]